MSQPLQKKKVVKEGWSLIREVSKEAFYILLRQEQQQQQLLLLLLLLSLLQLLLLLKYNMLSVLFPEQKALYNDNKHEEKESVCGEGGMGNNKITSDDNYHVQCIIMKM